jgi:hypothetical protein
MKFTFGLCIFLGLCALGRGVEGLTPLSGEVSGTLTRQHSPYFVEGTLRVPPGQTLIVEPGVILKFRGYRKFRDPDLGRLVVEGAIRAVGTPDLPIIFTSETDDEAGGDTNGDGYATRPHPAEWGWVEILGAPAEAIDPYQPRLDASFTPSRPGEEKGKAGLLGVPFGAIVIEKGERRNTKGEKEDSSTLRPSPSVFRDTTSVLERCIIRYCSFHWALNLYTSVTVRNCEVVDCESVGIGVLFGRSRIEGCLIARNSSRGIRLHAGASADIVGNRILGNAMEGIDVGFSPGVVVRDNVISGHLVGISNPTGSTLIEGNVIAGNEIGLHNPHDFVRVKAVDNYWGDASGPRGPSNPDGKGDRVSDHVDFIPFLKERPKGL